MKNFLFFLLGLPIVIVIAIFRLVFVLPVRLILDIKWVQSERYKDSRKLQELCNEFDTRCSEILSTHGQTNLSMKAIEELASHHRYVELTNKKILVSQVMTICKRLLPKDVFNKNEFTILYFVKMSVGLISGKRTEVHAADAFSNISTVEDVLLALMHTKVVTEQVFKERFSLHPVEDIQNYLSMHIVSFKAGYQEPGPCG